MRKARGDSGGKKSPAPVELAIQPQSTGDPSVDARTAAGHMPDTAKTLAGAIDSLDKALVK